MIFCYQCTIKYQFQYLKTNFLNDVYKSHENFYQKITSNDLKFIRQVDKTIHCYLLMIDFPFQNSGKERVIKQV